MGGRRVNAKGEQVGFHLDTLNEGIVFLQARWLKCFELFSWLISQRILYVCMFCSSIQVGSCVVANRRKSIIYLPLMWNRCQTFPLCSIYWYKLFFLSFFLFLFLFLFLLVQRCPCLLILIDDEWSNLFILYFDLKSIS